MKYRALFCAALWIALAIVCAAPYTAMSAEAFDAEIIHIYDGDTVRLSDGRRVRMAGIDTPEIALKQYWADVSADRLRSLIKENGMRVRIVPISVDRYNRMVADIQTKSGRSLNEQMIYEGMAYFYYHKELPEDFERKLMKAQRRALRERAGCWKKILASSDADRSFRGNRSSRRFFSKDCKEGVMISKRNRENLDDLKEAFYKGYAPSRTCDIWPLQRMVK